MRRAAAALLVLLPLLPLLILAGDATAYNRKAAKAYDSGIAAAKAGNWPKARQDFEAALALDAKEGRIRVSGVKYMEYYPSLGLAEAALELGDKAGASAALDRFDGIKKPGGDQQSKASSLRARLAASSAPVEKPPPSGPSGPAPDAVAAKRALDSGDLAAAQRLARKAPTDGLSQEVLAAVDALLAERFKSAKRDQDAGALAAAEAKLEEILAADPGNSAASTLLSSVRADARRAKELLADARAALDRKRFDEAEEFARQARQGDAALSDDARALERQASKARSSAAAAQSSSQQQASSRGENADALLSAARKALDAGKLADARRKASDALSASPGKKAEVEAVQASIAKRGGDADEALRGARAAAAGGRFVDARRLAKEAESLDKGLGADAKRVLAGVDEGAAQAGRLMAKIEAHLESGSSQSARSAVEELAAAFPEHPELVGLRASVAGSGELVAGLRAYFRGDWAASIDSLTPLLATYGERSDLLAVLGSAHATRGLLNADGESDLARARELFAQALAANPKLELDARYFSPRVRALFDEARDS